MKKTMRGVCATMLALLAMLGIAQAQDYPNRPIRVVVPWPPGGPSDIISRMATQRMTEDFRQSTIVDNRPGANGIIGADIVAKAAPDGYTLVIDNVTGHAINVSLYRKLPFNLLEDFAPVSLMAFANNILVVHPSTPVASVKDVIAEAKAKPGQLAYASFGTGSTAHLAGELFKTMAGVEMTHVPYKGGAPALADLMGGRVYLMFASLPSAISFVRGGKLKALATTGAKRSAVTANLPTMIESGLPGFEETSYYGAMFPANTPNAVVLRMNKEINAIVTAPETRAKLEELAFDVAGSTPEEFRRHMKNEIVKYAKIVKESGAQLD